MCRTSKSHSKLALTQTKLLQLNSKNVQKAKYKTTTTIKTDIYMLITGHSCGMQHSTEQF